MGLILIQESGLVMKLTNSLILCIFYLFSFLHAERAMVVFPYRMLETGTSISDGFALNGEKLYLSTLFDGHIYEFNLQTKTLKDRFRLREKSVNKNSPAGLLYVSETQKLYAGTGKSFERVPELYVFDTTGDTIPETVITIDTLGVYSFFNPKKVGDYIYWGCYHTQPNSYPKIVKLDMRNNHWQVIEYKQSDSIRQNYTYALQQINDILYVSTESGYILKYDLRSDRFLTDFIDLTEGGNKFVQHLATDGKGLWALCTEYSQPLFYIEKPEKRTPAVYRVPKDKKILFSRIYASTDGSLYGQGYRIKYTSNGNFAYQKYTYTNFENLRDIIGGFRYNGNDYFIGDNRYIKDVRIDRREFRLTQLPARRKPEIIEIDDIKSKKTGAILLTLGSDKQDKLYVSTYYIGAMFSVDGDLQQSARYLVDNRNVRFNEQADIITDYPGSPGAMLFGCYKGSGGSGILYIKNPLRTRGLQWAEKSLPVMSSKTFPRITATAFDSGNNVYVGTGEMTINAATPTAALFKMPTSEILTTTEINFGQPISYEWPQNNELEPPIRIVSLIHYNPYLYCISYHSYKNGIRNRFFRVNMETSMVEISGLQDAAFAGVRYRLLYKDGNRLVVGFGSSIYVYDLVNFNFQDPLKTFSFAVDSDIVKAIVGNENSYFVCMDKRIEVFDKELQKTRTINISHDGDIFQSIDTLNGKLYAITKNGLLIKYEIEN